MRLIDFYNTYKDVMDNQSRYRVRDVLSRNIELDSEIIPIFWDMGVKNPDDSSMIAILSDYRDMLNIISEINEYFLSLEVNSC